jgi:hypothetical protein
MPHSGIKGGRVLLASRLRILKGLMMVAAGASLIACHKDAPKKEPEKPAPVVVKKSPEEIKQLAASATESLENLKPLLAGLSEKYKSLHTLFDPLPPDLPDFEPTREKFNGADEGVGRMNAKVGWLTGRIDAAVKAGDGAELEEIPKSIDSTRNDVSEALKVYMELIHEVMPFTRAAEEYEANKRALCASDKTGPDAVSKKSSVR